MDNVFEYKKNLCDYINSLDDNRGKITITLEDLLYIILTNEPRNDQHLHSTLKKLVLAFKNNLAKSDISSLKKLIYYSSNSGLDDELNKEIYNFLLIDQVIKKNDELLKEEFDEKLNEMNNSLKIRYQNEKDNLINLILQ